MMTMTEKPARARRTTPQEVMDAIIELHSNEQTVTRDAINRLTCIRKTAIDDHLEKLIDDDKIMRVERGVYVPIEQYEPARAMSQTLLPSGKVKVEIGDQVIELVPREARMLGQMMSGFGLTYAGLGLGREVAYANAHNEVLLREARARKVDAA